MHSSVNLPASTANTLEMKPVDVIPCPPCERMSWDNHSVVTDRIPFRPLLSSNIVNTRNQQSGDVRKLQPAISSRPKLIVIKRKSFKENVIKF